MNKLKTGIGLGVVVLLLVLSTAPLWAQRNSMNGDIDAIVQDMEVDTLSGAEESGILLMREEIEALYSY